MGQSSSSDWYYDTHAGKGFEKSQPYQEKPSKPPPRPPKLSKQHQGSQGGLTGSLLKSLNIVESECANMMSIVKNIQEDYFEGAEGYLLDVLKQTEKELHEFIQTKKWPKSPEQESSKRLYSDLTELKKENQKLKDLNKKLEHDNLYLDGIINKQESEGKTEKGDVQSTGNQSNKPPGSKNKERKKHKKAQVEKDTIQNLQKEIISLQVKVESFKAHCDTQEANIRDLLVQNRRLIEQKDDFMLRLSKKSGDNLVRHNPAIADLSDPNRPTKLGEVYSEIYDNEWTDAFERLTHFGYKEEEAINTLRLTLLNAVQFCSRKSEKLLSKTEEAINILFQEYRDTEQENMPRHLTMPKNVADQWGQFARQSSVDDYLSDILLQEMWKPRSGHRMHIHAQTTMKVSKPEAVLNQLKIFRKEVAESMVPIVQKAYLKASWNDREYIDALKPFIKKCLFLGWMMVVQSPPMTLTQCRTGEKFDKNMYKEYTTRGQYISYVVWPALLLNQDGPVVGKGVAQGKKG